MTIPALSILAATDMSPGSNEIVGAAGELAARSGAELHLFHAVAAPRWPGGEDVLDMQRRIHDARAALRAMAEQALPEGVRLASVQVALGGAADSILERAARVGAGLIVIGPHRTRPFADRVLGTTADELIRESSIPCLIIRGPFSPELRRIVVPSDLSEVAQGTLAVALRWGAALQGSANLGEETRLTVVHVDGSASDDRSELGDSPQSWSELGRQVAAVSGSATAKPSVRVDREILRGASPAEEIRRFVRESGADLVVMGTRGDRPLVKALLGSVSASVARDTEIPLLLVPPAMWTGERDGTHGGGGAVRPSSA